METSNLIALGALIVAMIGLVPQFLQVMHQKKSKSRKVTKGTISRSSLNDKKSTSEETTEAKDTEVSKEPMPFMLRILMLVVFAVASFLIEIIIFGIVAHYCDVVVDLATMTLLWKTIFYSLFFIPGVFLFLAFLTFVANTTD